MLTGLIISIVIFIFLLLFAVYKRDMVVKMFSLRVDDQANLFQEQLEQTADKVITRLEEQITHLELLLEEADRKITLLDNKIQVADESANRVVQSVVLGKEDIHQLIESEIIRPKETNNFHTSPEADVEVNNNSSSNSEVFSHDKRRLIIAMADQGYSATEIAKATGLGKGEIMLLLQLNKR